MARVVGEQQFLSATITSYSAVNMLVIRVAKGVAVSVIGFCVLLVWEIGEWRQYPSVLGIRTFVSDSALTVPIC